MISDLIKSTCDFLYENGLNNRTIVQRDVTIGDNGGTNVQMCVSDAMFSMRKTEIPFPLQISSFFSILDAYVDLVNSNAGNLNFRKRYQHLPDSDDFDKIIKELYRIFRKLRNYVIHDASNISINEQEVCFPDITLTRDTLRLLYSLTCECFSYSPQRHHSHTYHFGVLRYYYDQVLLQIEKAGYQDDITQPFIRLSEDVRIAVNVRYLIQNTHTTVGNDCLIIQAHDCGGRQWGYRNDYRLVYEDKVFCVPEEALSSDNSISISMLEDWKEEIQP